MADRTVSERQALLSPHLRRDSTSASTTVTPSAQKSSEAPVLPLAMPTVRSTT